MLRFHDNSSTDISSTTLRLQTFRLQTFRLLLYTSVQHSYTSSFCFIKSLFSLILLRPRSVSVSVLDIRDLRTSSLRTDPSTSGATPKLVTGGWSGFFA